mmetsp:Transcript_27925/g.71892  ORF Transcript_27925/g.71892 Transcript_27925/m.71892 type:complete len:82 (+) Transcript_27925:103-348(+)
MADGAPPPGRPRTREEATARPPVLHVRRIRQPAPAHGAPAPATSVLVQRDTNRRFSGAARGPRRPVAAGGHATRNEVLAKL